MAVQKLAPFISVLAKADEAPAQAPLSTAPSTPLPMPNVSTPTAMPTAAEKKLPILR